MRITGGQYKGRKLEAPQGQDVRPSSDRTRQAIFNILTSQDWIDLDGAIVLDAFCGTGALGIEALSHGASYCMFTDKSAESITFTRKNTHYLPENDYTTIKTSATDIKSLRKTPNLVFLDPPYGQNLIENALKTLIERNLIADQALIICEHEKGLTITHPALSALNTRNYGKAALTFLRYSKPA